LNSKHLDNSTNYFITLKYNILYLAY